MTKLIGRRSAAVRQPVKRDNLVTQDKRQIASPTVLRLAQDKRRDRNDGVTLCALE
jgi:hypothetical protein